jgi:hypothetical protein
MDSVLELIQSLGLQVVSLQRLDDDRPELQRR